MAGDWIKIERATCDKPEVAVMANRLKSDPDLVVGKLVRIWAWADENSVDGNAIPVTESFLDRIAHKKGFAAAMRKAGWLTGENGSLSFPGFGRHNGSTAKGRADTNRRVAVHRKRNKNVTPEPLQKPLPEKRREEYNGSKEPYARNGASSGSVPAITWDAESGFAGILPEHRQRWAAAYPAVHVPQQIAAASEWLRVNPAKKKKSFERFLVNWLARCQERGGDFRANKPEINLDLGGRHPKAIRAIPVGAKASDDDSMLKF